MISAQCSRMGAVAHHISIRSLPPGSSRARRTLRLLGVHMTGLFLLVLLYCADVETMAHAS